MKPRGGVTVVLSCAIAVLTALRPVAAAGQTGIPDSARIVQLLDRQFEALNAHDLTGYLDMFTDDIRVYLFPDSLVNEGKPGFAEVYEQLFANYPRLTAHPTVVSIEGAFVMITETIRNAPGPTGSLREVAIFEFDGDRIRRFWFFPPRPIP